MFKFYSEIVSDKDCRAIKKIMLNHLEKKELSVEHNFTNGSYGYYNLPTTLLLVDDIEKKIKKDYGNDYIFENTFTRIYLNGHNLTIHTDRPGLDLTLSVCIYSNLDFLWPIYISNVEVDGLWSETGSHDQYAESYQTFVTPIGSGVACLGTRNPHWRDKLNCKDHQMMIQSFFHWKKK